MYTWGNGAYGQLGQGLDCEMTAEPRLVAKLKGRDIISIACGQNHTMFVSSSGLVYACGNGYYGQLGLAQGVDYVREKKQLMSSIHQFQSLLFKGIPLANLHVESLSRYSFGTRTN